MAHKDYFYNDMIHPYASYFYIEYFFAQHLIVGNFPSRAKAICYRDNYAFQHQVFCKIVCFGYRWLVVPNIIEFRNEWKAVQAGQSHHFRIYLNELY